jgi:hypothetical protein
MTTISILIIVAMAIFFYKSLTEPSDEQLLANREAEKKATDEMVEFKKNEMVFNQFNKYIEKLFVATKELTLEDLRRILANDFPHYKKDDPFDLFYDLSRAGLIESDYKTKLYHKGSAFYDLRLTYPTLLEFLKGKSFGPDRFSSDVYRKFAIKKGRISKEISSSGHIVFYYFGVGRGNDVLKELKMIDHNIANESLYLYTMTEQQINHYPLPTEKKLLQYDYVILRKELLPTQYEKYLNDWFVQSKELVKTIQDKP